MIDPTVLRQLCEQATPGPWRLSSSWDIECPDCDASAMVCDVTAEHEDGTEYLSCQIQATGLEDFAKPNAEFIAAAREALPQLLDENAALRTKTEEMQRWIDHHNERADKAESRLAALKEAGEKVVAKADGVTHLLEREYADSARFLDALNALKTLLRSDP